MDIEKMRDILSSAQVSIGGHGGVFALPDALVDAVSEKFVTNGGYAFEVKLETACELFGIERDANNLVWTVNRTLHKRHAPFKVGSRTDRMDGTKFVRFFPFEWAGVTTHGKDGVLRPSRAA